MTAIHHTLQRDIFLPSEERLIAFCNVIPKSGKKKKICYLCAAVTTERPVQARVYEVRKAEKAEIYKKKITWLLSELKVVDGKDNVQTSSPEFDLHFDKVFRWIASSVPDKESFISSLFKLSQRYLVQKPEFVNVPVNLVEEHHHDPTQSFHHGDEAPATEDDYQALSTKEESDLELLMAECQAAVGNAELFADQLNKQLSVLDGENIHTIMGSEDQVLNLMRLIDDSIEQANDVETKLDSYDNILQNVKEQMDMMSDKDMLINIRNTNHQKLLDELDNMINSLDLNHTYIKSLFDGDLSTPGGIYECTVAAEALHCCMHAAIHPSLGKMVGVEEQVKTFTKLTASFKKRLAHYLNNLFIHQGNEGTLTRTPNDLKLPEHYASQRDLTPYAELMSWLKKTDNTVFDDLKRVYKESIKKLYEREINEFLESAKFLMFTRNADKSKLNVAVPMIKKISSSSSSLTKSENKSYSSSMQSIDSASSFQGSDADLEHRQLVDQTFEKVLGELEPVCLSEQDFCVKFFHLSRQPDDRASDGDEEYGDEVWMPRKSTPYKERRVNEEVRKMMRELFPSLERELDNFVQYVDKIDGFNSLYMLVRMAQHVSNTEDAGSFLSMTFASCLVRIKRNFDRFVQIQIRAIEETKVPKKNKVGILSFVHNFEQFANQAEIIFRGSPRKTDLEKAYPKLVRTVFDQITRVAHEQLKTPREVVLLENFHHMNGILSHLKLTCLDGERKEAKQKYTDSLYAYTTNNLGNPMEKLHIFVEGIQARVASGVKEEEVGYQLAFSKLELRKIIKEYPGKEVKKGLDHLYKKVEKHLCDEENLLQVVWVTMQDEFIKQYKQYDELIKRCYPDSQISLEFSMEDVLLYFSLIARSH